MGLSSAYHLARSGCKRVTLLEKKGLFGAGATGENAGGIRHQFSTAVNIELSKHSIAMLREFEETMGQPIDLRLCGYLFLIDNELDLKSFHSSVLLQHALGIGTEELGPNEILDRLPEFNLEGVIGGTYYSGDGLADPGGVVQGYASQARRMGADLRVDCPALEIVTAGDRITGVRTVHETIHTQNVLIAAGPWSSPLAGQIGVYLPVQPLRRQIMVTRPLDIDLDRMPFVIDFSQSLYFHPEGGGILTGMSNPNESPGFKTGLDDEWRLTHLSAALHRLPLLEGAELQTEWAGHYETTPDSQAIIGRIPEFDGLFTCTGFSGHGFMHGPVCGLLMAEEILEGKARTVDITPLRWDRFKQRELADEFNVI